MRPTLGVMLTDFNAGRPGWHQRSLGAYHLAHVLTERGVHTRVLDFFYSLTRSELEFVAKTWINSETRFIGVSTTFLYNRLEDLSFESNFNFDPQGSLEFFLNKCREISPGIQVFQGGNFHATKHKLVDHLILGQGIENDFIRALNQHCGLGIEPDFNFVEHHFEFNAIDGIVQGEPLPLEVSRGCIFSCKFCAFTGRGKKVNTNIKKPEALKQFLESSHRKFKTQTFYLSDDTFNESEAKLEMFLNVVRSLNFKPTFVCYIRLDLLIRFPRMITLLAEIGVRGIAFGIETFNHAAGRAVGKGTAPEIVKQFLMDLRKSHPEFYLGSGFIVGLPHESIESVYETNDWLVQAKVLDTWHFSPLAIYNGPSSPSLSEFSKTIEQYDYTREGLYGWRRKDLDFAEAGRHSQILNRANDDRVGPSPWTLLSLQRQHTDLEELRKIRNGSIAKSLDVEKFELYRNAILLPARGSSALMQSER